MHATALGSLPWANLSPTLSLAGLVLIGVVACGPTSPPAPIEHVVLVTLDTLRADHLPTYGYPRATAPFIDSLARRGVVFENVRASSSHTTPTHASLFTGLHPYQHGAIGNGSAPSAGVTTLAERLGRVGFTTAGFTSVKFLQVLKRGFDHFDAYDRANRKVTFRPGSMTTDAAIDWLGGRSSDERIFLWLHLFDVHDYTSSPPEYEAAARALAAESTAEEEELKEILERLHGVPREQQARRPLVSELVEYDARIRYVDAEIMRLHAAIERFAPGESTLWVITADHGEALGDHGYIGHGKYLYEEQLRIPLVVHVSDERLAPRRVERLVRQIDVTPTVLDLVDGPALLPDELTGISLAALLHGRAMSGPAPTAFAQRRPATPRAWGGRASGGDGWSVTGERYKLLVYSATGEELYDLREDPLEHRNLIADPPAEALALRAELRRHLEAARAAGSTPVSTEYLQELRDLGYIE